MLALPSKQCEVGVGDLVGGVRELITGAYGSLAAQAHIADATSLKRARERAVKKGASTEADAAAAEEPLLLYAAMLSRAQAALGAEAREQKSLELSWKSAWADEKEKPSKAHDLVAEQAGVFYSLAAAWSVRGALPALAEGESIKAAAKFFQQAAGALAAAQQLQPETTLDDDTCPSDLSDAALGAASKLMLAQAQACFCEKAALDKLGASLQHKLNVGARDLYAQANEAIAPLKTKCKGLHAWGAALASAREKQYEANARWHAASEAEAAGGHGVRQAQLALCIAAAQSAQTLLAGAGEATKSEATKAALVSLLARANETHTKVKQDNELVYYEKCPSADTLPSMESKILAKATPVAPMVEALATAPLPPAVRHADESDLSAGDELVSELFSRLDGGEFKMIPLAERYASKQREDQMMQLAKDVAREADKKEKEERNAGGILGSIFGGGGKASGSAKDSKDDSSSGKDKVEKAASKAKPASPKETKEKPSTSKPSKGAKAGSAGGTNEDDDEALQAALAASLKDLDTASSSPPVVRRESSGSGRGGDVLSRANAAAAASRPPPPPPIWDMPARSASGGGGGGGPPPPPSFEEAAAMPSVAAVEGSVAQLVSMGFARPAALDALKQCGYDVTAAAERLLK